jgi:hypothetical protein
MRVDGDVLWLARSDGKIAKTAIANLSQRDREYVASWQEKPAANESESSLPQTVIEGAAETIETLSRLPGVVSDVPPASAVAAVPAAIVYVRVSRDFLEDYVERTVRRRKPVRDCVLGTRVVGESDTRGKTYLKLLPSNDRLLARIAFEGTLRAHTRGYHGPITFRYISDSVFHAHKLITVTDDGVTAGRATAVAPTELRTVGMSTSLPRLRGRISLRIAGRRMSRSHGRAEAITADHTADDIRDDFDSRVTHSLSDIKRVLGTKIPELETARSPMPTDVRFRCRAESVEMAILREDATPEERKLRPPPAAENADVSVRVHRTLLTSALEDPQLLQQLMPLFTKLLEARPGSENANGHAPTWSIDLNWVSMDFNKG